LTQRGGQAGPISPTDVAGSVVDLALPSLLDQSFRSNLRDVTIGEDRRELRLGATEKIDA
jgi:hypothetical protein